MSWIDEFLNMTRYKDIFIVNRLYLCHPHYIIQKNAVKVILHARVCPVSVSVCNTSHNAPSPELP